eukprot:4997337-Prymnesium_polylepis.2
MHGRRPPSCLARNLERLARCGTRRDTATHGIILYSCAASFLVTCELTCKLGARGTAGWRPDSLRARQASAMLGRWSWCARDAHVTHEPQAQQP